MKRFALPLLLALAACARPVPAGVTELTYATPYPPSHPFSRADQRWIDYVEMASGGTLQIHPVWSGALLSSDMSLEELRHGVADIGLITPIYTRGGTHLVRIQSGFYSGADTIADQVAVYRCLERSVPEIGHEMSGLHVLAIQGGLLPGVITSKKPVRSLEDLNGMRIRAPTELLAVLRGLGADPVNMPMGDVYSAMARGVIDGVVAPVDTFKVLHFDEVGRYFATLKVPRGAYPSRAIGDKAWQRLTSDQQALLERSTGVWESALADEIEKGAVAGARAARAAGIVVHDISPAEQSRFDALYLEDAEKNARKLAKLDIDGLDAFRKARASITETGIKCGVQS
ncbi:ABC transporter substrate-binding protein [Altererythrobacter salegens]|uniref:ABC transporter substrate-binding protein n=1 Tax=Croceibacterium salegens TaxID=1737568 RepID=A0A6I4SRL2_9SPHN|nr:ABC transporter substrate-binding protein [Croceibacterium salegens]